jgi:hypothetical protein
MSLKSRLTTLEKRAKALPTGNNTATLTRLFLDGIDFHPDRGAWCNFGRRLSYSKEYPADLTLDTADKLCRHFGVRLTQPTGPRRTEKTAKGTGGTGSTSKAER